MKIPYSTLLLSGFLFLGNASRVYSQEKDENATWYDDQPWAVQSNPGELDPYYGLDEKDREKIAKRHLKKEAKRQGKEIIMSYEIAEKIKTKLIKLRDKRLTLKVGEVPKELETETEKYSGKEEEKKGFLIIRPGKSGLEIAARNPTHIEVEAEAGIRGVSVKASSALRIKIPFTKMDIPLPTFETGYDISDGYFIGTKYEISF